MSTNRAVIEHSLRMLGVLDANETAQIEDANLGLTEMNDLFASLQAENIDLGYPPQDGLEDDFPLDAVAEAQAKILLAAALFTHYPSSRGVDQVRVDGAMSALRRVSVLEAMEESGLTHLPMGERHYSHYDIDIDE